MKTKLLLLFLVIFSLGKAQVTFSENFDAATPDLTGWVYSDFALNSNLPCSGTKSLTKDFNAINSTGTVTTKNYVSNGNAIKFTHTYKMLKLGLNNAQADFKLGYSVNNGANVTVLFLSGGYVSSCSAGFTMDIPASAVPAGSNVKIWVQYIQHDYTFRLGLDNFAAVQESSPSILSASANPSYNNAKINYVVNANSLPSTSVINYGLSSTALSSQVTGSTAAGTADTALVTDIPSLSPETTYYYQVVATNSLGSTSSTVNSFKTGKFEPIAEYNFNNTYNNVNGNTPFSSNAGTSFTTDRNANPSAAININNTGSTATILNLPLNNQQRTVSMWVKYNVVNTNINFLYHYGTSASGNGGYTTTFAATQFGVGGNHSANSPNVVNTWYHMVFVYDGENSLIYKNGVLQGTLARAWNVVNNGDLFRLGLTETGGANFFNGAIDDLKIYNYAISQSQVTALYNPTTLATTENNASSGEISIYPNPAKDFVNIQSNIKVKSVEIYNMAGQKVLNSKETKINTTNLKPGVYMVKIKDVANQISSQKLIIK